MASKRQKEARVCEVSLREARELGFKGMVVYTKAKTGAPLALPEYAEWSLRGFTLGQALGRDQSVIAIEKTDLNVRGLAQFIFSEFCAACWADRPFVNVGDDWGLETLAWTKMSYRPARLLQKYEVRLAKPVAVSMPIGGRDAVAQPADVIAQATAPAAEVLPAPILTPLQPVAEPIVRPAQRADVNRAVELEQSCFSAYCLSKRQLQYLQNRPSAIFLVVEDAGKIVGEGICLVRKHKRSVSGRIYSLAVSAEYRRRQIGRRLLTAMCRRCWREAYRDLPGGGAGKRRRDQALRAVWPSCRGGPAGYYGAAATACTCSMKPPRRNCAGLRHA